MNPQAKACDYLPKQANLKVRTTVTAFCFFVSSEGIWFAVREAVFG